MLRPASADPHQDDADEPSVELAQLTCDKCKKKKTSCKFSRPTGPQSRAPIHDGSEVHVRFVPAVSRMSGLSSTPTDTALQSDPHFTRSNVHTGCKSFPCTRCFRLSLPCRPDVVKALRRPAAGAAGSAAASGPSGELPLAVLMEHVLTRADFKALAQGLAAAFEATCAGLERGRVVALL